MARTKHVAKTIHPLDMAESIAAQSQAVGLLLAQCETVLTLGAVDERIAGEFRKQVDACRAAMYPEKE